MQKSRHIVDVLCVRRDEARGCLEAGGCYALWSEVFRGNEKREKDSFQSCSKTAKANTPISFQPALCTAVASGQATPPPSKPLPVPGTVCGCVWEEAAKEMIRSLPGSLPGIKKERLVQQGY